MSDDDQRNEFIDQTLRVWHQHSDCELTRDDAREMIENISGFFRLPNEWDIAERNQADVGNRDELNMINMGNVA